MKLSKNSIETIAIIFMVLAVLTGTFLYSHHVIKEQDIWIKEHTLCGVVADIQCVGHKYTSDCAVKLYGNGIVYTNRPAIIGQHVCGLTP